MARHCKEINQERVCRNLKMGRMWGNQFSCSKWVHLPMVNKERRHIIKKEGKFIITKNEKVNLFSKFNCLKWLQPKQVYRKIKQH